MSTILSKILKDQDIAQKLWPSAMGSAELEALCRDRDRLFRILDWMRRDQVSDCKCRTCQAWRVFLAGKFPEE